MKSRTEKEARQQVENLQITKKMKALPGIIEYDEKSALERWAEADHSPSDVIYINNVVLIDAKEKARTA
jgi:hypothetical protein